MKAHGSCSSPSVAAFSLVDNFLTKHSEPQFPYLSRCCSYLAKLHILVCLSPLSFTEGNLGFVNIISISQVMQKCGVARAVYVRL